MDDIERMMREIPERRRLAKKAPEPLATFLTGWFIDRQDRELKTLQEARDAEPYKLPDEAPVLSF